MLKINIGNIFSIVMIQFTMSLKEKLEAHPDWNQMPKDEDYI